MKKISKKLLKTIILSAVAVVLAVALIVSNYFIDYYSLIINRFIVGDTADSSGEETQDALAAADKVVRTSAEESIVLLKNDKISKAGEEDKYFLPLKNLKKVNLFGYGSTDAGLLLTGAGSGGTTITDTLKDGTTKRIKVDLTDAFKEAGIEYNTALTAAYEEFSTFDADFRASGSTGALVTESLLNPEESFYSDALMNEAKSFSDTAVAVISRWGAENGNDKGGAELKNIGGYTNGAFLELTEQEKAMFKKLQEKNFNVVVLLNVCNNVELGFLEEYSCIKACLHIGIPGQSGCAAIPKILNGEVNPSGRTSDTLAYDYQTNDPTYINVVKNGNDLTYQEGIYFGYKWYETADAEGYFANAKRGNVKGYNAVVQYPFGYGLSYTQFSWDITWPQSTELTADGTYKVKVKVTNNGKEAGKDVVQLYGHAPYKNGGIEKAERVLLDFVKTPLIEAGRSVDVELEFTSYDLASYDEYDKNGNGFKGYELDAFTAEDKAGDYEIYVMKNAHEKVGTQKMTIAGNIRFENDPVTGAPVGNLFTGDNAYAACPIDGSTAFTNKIDYLSRKDKFANMPENPAGTTSNSVTSKAANFRYEGYNDKDVSGYSYGSDIGFYLVGVEQENAASLRATLEMLNGEDSSVALTFNKDILDLLEDYDSEYWDIFLDQLSEQDVKDLIGKGGFQTIELYSIGKPRCTDKDGPAGFNNNVTNAGKSSEYTLFPSESLLGCSWNTELAYDIGEAQANIGTSMGINGWYGPGVNLHRSVYNSRNYEYYSEDAVLSGKLAAFTIKGAKEHNLYCYLKHFAVSEAGQNPKNLNTWLTEQALRESYLKPFEIAVKKGGANAMMSAFNNIGATLSGYNHALLTNVLREEWGFRGSVITDWFMGGGYMENHELGILGGNDLWLCGTTNMAANLDLKKPEIAYAARQSCKNIIYTYINTNLTASGITVNAEARSDLFTALWVVLDILLIAGIGVCVVFAVLPYLPKKKKNGGETAEDTLPAESSDNPE
ncbi:MAG: glycoside hydrolase family 3 C-terminal domain-containing protein [Clostridia bacterium]|nr:glycoside hydrolase family 3 C-terminal domain-containing protein [Clostridia bacterium]